MRSLSLLLASLFLLSATPKNWLFVVHAQAGQINQSSLLLKGVNEIIASFDGNTDMMTVGDLFADWPSIFAHGTPKATLASTSGGGKISERLLILEAPSHSGETIHFSIKELDTPFSGSLGETLLFIEVQK
ncbi:MAG: hypothetical protein S4CHLAM81_00140 [Chlamydiales bacterium]|nr:hypothetical protein [Chlamydiales bacterium]MCH9634816.1 hypothetical protein [Chlamydiales bacterium]MCH9703518.1 hypothetical protein [Chlamydiota bacterium]